MVLLFAPHRDILYRERLFHRNAAFENKEQLIFIHHLDGVDKLPHDVVAVFCYFKGGIFQRLADVVNLPGEFIRTVLLRLVLLQCFLQGFDFLRNLFELVLVAFGVSRLPRPPPAPSCCPAARGCGFRLRMDWSRRCFFQKA